MLIYTSVQVSWLLLLQLCVYLIVIVILFFVMVAFKWLCISGHCTPAIVFWGQLIFLSPSPLLFLRDILCIVSRYTARAWSIQPASFLVVASCIKIKDIFVTGLATSFIRSPLKSK